MNNNQHEKESTLRRRNDGKLKSCEPMESDHFTIVRKQGCG